MNPDLLRGISIFVEVAKLKSVTRAAAALDMPKSTVSRRVSSLERDIGLRLLKRTTKKIELTEEGQDYFQKCQQILEAVESAHEQLTGKRVAPSGHLRVAMTADFALRLVSTLPNFCREHPKISLEIDLTTRRVDPATESCDVAVYIGPLPDSALTAHKLAQVHLHLYAAPGYLVGKEPPATPADLTVHSCILAQPHGPEPKALWELHNGDQRVRIKLAGTLILNSIGLIQRLTIAGAGIGLLPEDLCRKEVEAGRLVRVLDGWRSAPLQIHALTASRLLPAKTRVFLDYLKMELRTAGQES